MIINEPAVTADSISLSFIDKIFLQTPLFYCVTTTALANQNKCHFFMLANQNKCHFFMLSFFFLEVPQ